MVSGHDALMRASTVSARLTLRGDAPEFLSIGSAECQRQPGPIGEPGAFRVYADKQGSAGATQGCLRRFFVADLTRLLKIGGSASRTARSFFSARKRCHGTQTDCRLPFRLLRRTYRDCSVRCSKSLL
jgi:hypothetical protein